MSTAMVYAYDAVPDPDALSLWAIRRVADGHICASGIQAKCDAACRADAMSWAYMCGHRDAMQSPAVKLAREAMRKMRERFDPIDPSEDEAEACDLADSALRFLSGEEVGNG